MNEFECQQCNEFYGDLVMSRKRNTTLIQLNENLKAEVKLLRNLHKITERELKETKVALTKKPEYDDISDALMERIKELQGENADLRTHNAELCEKSVEIMNDNIRLNAEVIQSKRNMELVLVAITPSKQHARETLAAINNNKSKNKT